MITVHFSQSASTMHTLLQMLTCIEKHITKLCDKINYISGSLIKMAQLGELMGGILAVQQIHKLRFCKKQIDVWTTIGWMVKAQISMI